MDLEQVTRALADLMKLSGEQAVVRIVHQGRKYRAIAVYDGVEAGLQGTIATIEVGEWDGHTIPEHPQ